MITLADAIIQGDMESVRQLLDYNDINQIDEYGFRPIIEAAISNRNDIGKFLLSQGADPNLQDAAGGTALQWAAENNNIALCRLLLKQGANPNAYNFAGQPVLVMPTLRRQAELRQLLIRAGADETFAYDYINTKLLGHMFELIGTTTIISPQNEFVEVDFEGFYLEVTLGIIADSLLQFQNHFAARQLRRYAGLAQFIVEIIKRAAELSRYQRYSIDINQHQQEIETLLSQDPLLIPVGYEGHAITFIKRGDIWVKCDRREDSRLYDNVMFYKVGNPEQLTLDFLKNLLYEKHNAAFINEDLDIILGLQPLTELKIEAQISGNCSWANVEAAIPAIFFLVMMQMSHDHQAIAHYKTLALNFFHRWREWNKDRALHWCIQAYQEGDVVRKACKAEILAAILFERCDIQNRADRERIDLIMSVLLKSPYEYLLQNYLRVYHYENYTEAGKRFAALLKEYDFLKR